MDQARIAEMLKKYPAKVLDSGNIRLPPARLSYPNVFEKSKPRGKIKEEKFTATFLFPKGCDLKPVVQYFMKAGADEGMALATMQALARERIQEQAKKAEKVTGYEAGAFYLQAKSDYQPTIITLGGKDIVDPRAVYGGCWVIGLIDAYKYKEPIPGMTWGLQSLVKLCDDESFGGGASLDPREELGDILDGTADAGALFGDSKAGGTVGEDSIFG